MGDEQRKRAFFDDRSRYVDRFGLLLVVTTIAVITLSLVDLSETLNDVSSDLGLLAVSVFVGASLLLALRASGVGRRYRLIAEILIGLGIVSTLGLVLFEIGGESEPVAAYAEAPSMIWLILSLVAPVLVVRRLIHHRRATIKTLLGAVSAYLLIALAFNFSFLMLDSLGDPFFGSAEPTTSFMYYSMVTLTTLGYGDLAAVDPLGRLLSTIEAVLGQVYLVTFVAMIVGLLVEQSQRARSDSESS